jgi:hypothetical protein
MNKELLLKVNAWVQAEDAKRRNGEKSEWDQETWACKTACCFAGKAVLESGGCFVFKGPRKEVRCVLNGDEQNIAFAAKQILGINWKDATKLFSGGRKAADIDAAVREIIAEEAQR